MPNVSHSKNYLVELPHLMQLIEKGEFMMDDSKISFSHDFYFCKYPVTQGLWQSIMNNNPSQFKGNDRPVESVKRTDILRYFLPKLNELTGEKYRLPTEAEWEYVAIGGKNGNQKLKYAGSDFLKEVGWFEKNSFGETKPVGLKKANELGIFDMSGNVWEFCRDEWHNHLMNMPEDGRYRKHLRRTGSIPVIRGGAWNGIDKLSMATSRKRGTSNYGSNDVGFRLAKSTTYE